MGLDIKTESQLANKEPLSGQDLINVTFVVPTTIYPDVWEEVIKANCRFFGFEARTRLIEADSWNDFVLSDFNKDDVFFCPYSWLTNPIFNLRTDLIVRTFNPAVEVTSYVAFRVVKENDPNAAAIYALKQFFENSVANARHD